MSEPADPIARFNEALRRAEALEPDVPNAITLATADGDGRPSARVVLLHRADERGFTFFTNYNSRKGRDIEQNNKASLLFFWPEFERQVRIQGVIARLPEEDSDEYFRSRPLESQIGAWASRQSEVIGSRDELDGRFSEVLGRYAESGIPRPAHWGGFVLTPSYFEFWQGRAARLHDRLRYVQAGKGWKLERLMP